MSLLIQSVSTGDAIVFDKGSRDLFLYDKANAGAVKGVKSVDEAKRHAREGKARHFSKDELTRIQAALAGVVLLV